MTVIRRLFLPLLLALASFSISANEQSPLLENNDSPLEWLFIITTQNAEIKKNSQEKLSLLLPHANINKVLTFSKKPNRISKILSAQQFNALWQSSDLIRKAPPNAALVFGNKMITVKITDISTTKETTTLIIDSDDDWVQEMVLGNALIFIDPIALPEGNNTILQGKSPNSTINTNMM